jgi:hypothetical protein
MPPGLSFGKEIMVNWRNFGIRVRLLCSSMATIVIVADFLKLRERAHC